MKESEPSKDWLKYFYSWAAEAPELESQAICEKAVSFLERKYPAFFTHTASTRPGQHHYLVHGLAQHTGEVLQLGFSVRTLLHLKEEISFEDYFCAALYHDSGKVLAYEQLADGTWGKTRHGELFHHIGLSMNIWDEMVRTEGLNFPNNDIRHAILAHHGCREWGSPVRPATRMAQLLFQSDMMSARMNDMRAHDYKKQ
jgi:3'-5' exoribonuclease